MNNRPDVFISYRRDDAAGYAGRMYDALTVWLGEGSVFLDFETLIPGREYPRAIDEAISRCRVMLAVIGPGWLNAGAAADGYRRLEDPTDLVRLELAQALLQDKVVIPVLVRGASMPHQDHLPPPLRKLGFAHAIELHDADWTGSIAALTDAIGLAIGVGGARIGAFRSTTTNLPSSFASFVGRDDILERLVNAVVETHVVTVTGTGGVGKTRLAVEAAWRLQTAFDAVLFVDLAAVARSGDVAPAVANSLGIRPRGEESFGDAIRRQMAYRHALVLVDNCEHVVDAAAQVIASVTRESGESHVLATSRVPLMVAGERVVHLEPLPYPGSGVDPDAVIDCPAVQLLVDRIRLADQTFAVDATNAEAIAAICRALDGVPLALELAAARVRTMTVQEVATLLDRRFQLLTTGPRNAADRQQTLSALIRWSYDLLDENERQALCQLSVFAGGWDLLGASRVIEVGDSDPASLLASLVDKSLVERETEDGRSRYRLLETIRAFAAERLRAGGHDGLHQLQVRHRDNFLALSEGALARIEDAEFDDWLARLAIENDNLRAALAFTLEEPVEEMAALRFASALEEYWVLSGQSRTGADFISVALVSATKELDRQRGAAIVSLARQLDVLGQYEASCSRAAEVIENAALQQDVRVLVRAYTGYAGSKGRLGHLDEARESARAGVALAHVRSSMLDRVKGLVVSGFVEYCASDTEQAREFYEQAVEIAEPLGFNRALASVLNNLALIEISEERFDRAEQLLERAVGARGVTFHDDYGSAIDSLNLGLVAALRGNFEKAGSHYRTALRLAVRCGMEEDIAYAVLGLAVSAAAEEGDDRAASLLGVADGIIERLGVEFEPLEAALRASCREAIRVAIGKGAFEASYTEGQRMPRLEAVRFAGLC